MARPAAAGPTMAPPVHMRARPRGAPGGVLDGDDLGLEGRQGRPLEAGRHADEEDHRQDAGQAQRRRVEGQERQRQRADHQERRPSRG